MHFRRQQPTPTSLTLITALFAVLTLLLPLELSAQGSQLKVGILPVADNTGSNSGDVADSVSHAVQTQMVQSTKLMGVVLMLDSGLSPNGLDPGKAISIGQAQGVDVVLIGTIVEADSQQSSSSANLPPFGGISLGGSKTNVKATVTLQADLYSTSTGQKIDCIQQTGNASQSKIGSDVSTGLGSISTGGADFDNSAMGKAFHAAVSGLVKQVNSEQGQMTHFTQGGSPTAAAAAPPPGAALDASANQAGPAAPGSGATPSAAPAADSTAITAYRNSDFTPGDTILFADDFSTTQEGEFPDRSVCHDGIAGSRRPVHDEAGCLENEQPLAIAQSRRGCIESRPEASERRGELAGLEMAPDLPEQVRPAFRRCPLEGFVQVAPGKCVFDLPKLALPRGSGKLNSPRRRLEHAHGSDATPCQRRVSGTLRDSPANSPSRPHERQAHT